MLYAILMSDCVFCVGIDDYYYIKYIPDVIALSRDRMYTRDMNYKTQVFFHFIFLILFLIIITHMHCHYSSNMRMRI